MEENEKSASSENRVGTIRAVNIDHEMRSAYLDYAMSVIVSRALPDARDGLKPVQRRILYAMYDMGIRPNSAHKKSARIVGEVLGKYHPHGDSAVYEAMARLAQDFSVRYMLVDGQGNFGSIDGDSPAAMRYTEARLAKISMEMLADIDKETVAWIDNFDGSLQEPRVLPSILPTLLVNGASGIAVGMSTNIPPHNLSEVLEALLFLLDNWENQDDIGVTELMQFIKGPDFPTGGTIMGRDPIISAYGTGRGKVIVRAVARIEELRRGRHRIVVTEIPYQVNKTTLIEKIAFLVRNGKLDEISDLRDESDRRGMSIIIELKRGTQPQKALNRLYKHTMLQTTFGVRLLALVDGEPRLLPLKRLLLIFLQHRNEVVVRRARYELRRAQARAHILKGLLLALDHLDAVIRTIRESPDVATARERLIAKFEFSEIQARAILDMPLRRLTGLERQKILDEYAALQVQIAELEALLASPAKQRVVIYEELQSLAEKYGDERRTRIDPRGDASFNEEDFVDEERVLISITEHGYVKRVPSKVYRSQRRGGRGVIGMDTREEDEIVHLLSAGTLDTLLFFTNRGKVYQERVYQIPEASRTAKGFLLAGILPLETTETVTAVLNVVDFEGNGRYFTMITRRGLVKRVKLHEFAAVRPSGLIAIGLEEGDELGWVLLTEGDEDLILVTSQGQGIRFSEQAVRAVGRTARGVIAMRLAAADLITSAEVVEPDGDLLVVSAHGYGRRTPLAEFRPQGRGGKGMRAYQVSHKTGPVIDARIVQEEDEITMISDGGIMIRTPAANIPQMGRYTRGVQMMSLKEGECVASLARLKEEPEE
ncbi:MAG: DNA gyrase subunit A [Chloroflexota bacterium]|nr:DNA gyrase subunit A [Chloroflexota bacterium]